MALSVKQQQFNNAMELYNSRKRYTYLGRAVSIINITLQSYLLYRIWPQEIGAVRQILSLMVAYLLTDFINGLVHMFMDDNDNYTSLAGPLIANFHLHHKVPQYKKHTLPVVYFTESGSKIWLIGYLSAVLYVLNMPGANLFTLHVLVYTGILSSCAEVSHYLCHTSRSRVVDFLAVCGLLLSKRHHAKHHLQDNRDYAFLNGCTDPLLNLIAPFYCDGYKRKTDLHYACYSGLESDER